MTAMLAPLEMFKIAIVIVMELSRMQTVMGYVTPMISVLDKMMLSQVHPVMTVILVLPVMCMTPIVIVQVHSRILMVMEFAMPMINVQEWMMLL